MCVYENVCDKEQETNIQSIHTYTLTKREREESVSKIKREIKIVM